MCPQDVDEFFRTERDRNVIATGCTKNAAEVSIASLVYVQHTHTVMFDCSSLLLAEVPGCGAD